MQINSRDLYFVAVKVFLKKEGKFLICKDGFGQWDIPGGRLRGEDFETALEEVLAQKIRKELGDEVRYALGKPVVFMRHERTESAEGNPVVRIFAIGYEAELLSGDIKLTDHHTEMFWVDPANFQPENYFTGGWLKGVQDFCKAKNDEGKMTNE